MMEDLQKLSEINIASIKQQLAKEGADKDVTSGEMDATKGLEQAVSELKLFFETMVAGLNWQMFEKRDRQEGCIGELREVARRATQCELETKKELEQVKLKLKQSEADHEQAKQECEQLRMLLLSEQNNFGKFYKELVQLTSPPPHVPFYGQVSCLWFCFGFVSNCLCLQMFPSYNHMLGTSLGDNSPRSLFGGSPNNIDDDRRLG